MDNLQFKLSVFNVIRHIDYKPGWEILLRFDEERRSYYLQLEATTLDAVLDPPEPTRWRGGKRYLSTYMCRQEIVGICFDLIKAGEDHELREWFKYKGVRIYCPHIDPDWLADNVTKESLNVRNNAMTMEETDV